MLLYEILDAGSSVDELTDTVFESVTIVMAKLWLTINHFVYINKLIKHLLTFNK